MRTLRLVVVRTRHAARRRHLDDGLAELEEGAADGRVLAPVDRPVEAEQALELAVDVDDVFAVDHADGAAELLLDDRQRRREQDRGRGGGLRGGDRFPGYAVRFAVTRQA